MPAMPWTTTRRRKPLTTIARAAPGARRVLGQIGNPAPQNEHALHELVQGKPDSLQEHASGMIDAPPGAKRMLTLEHPLAETKKRELPGIASGAPSKACVLPNGYRPWMPSRHALPYTIADMAASIDILLDRAADLLEADRSVALCLLTNARGSTPAAAGAVMLVDDAAGLHGTIGGGCVEAEVRRRVVTMMSAGETGLLRFTLDHDYGWDDGLICGGTIDVAVALPRDATRFRSVARAYRQREPTQLSVIVHPVDAEAAQRYVVDLPPRPRLLVAGAGHIGGAVCRLALDLGFDVAGFDDRADLLERSFAPPARAVTGPIHETILREAIDADTYIVIVTRGHRHDEQVLHAVAETPARFIGMIGSRRKVKLIFDDLLDAGVPEAALRRVRAPIGLDINSVTVNEIALSIAAELTQVRRADHRSPVRGPLDVATAAP